MAGKRLMYKIVGRYLQGTEVTAYGLACNNGKNGRFSREQVAYLVGRGQVVNCDGQVYKDKLLLRGVGCSLDSLPSKQEPKEKPANASASTPDSAPASANAPATTNAPATANAPASTKRIASDNLEIIKTISEGKHLVGYIVEDAAGRTAKVSLNKAIQLTSKGCIANAQIQTFNGYTKLNGLYSDFRNLPNIELKGNDGLLQKSKSDNWEAKRSWERVFKIVNKLRIAAERHGLDIKTDFDGCYDNDFYDIIIQGYSDNRGRHPVILYRLIYKSPDGKEIYINKESDLKVEDRSQLYLLLYIRNFDGSESGRHQEYIPEQNIENRFIYWFNYYIQKSREMENQ